MSRSSTRLVAACAVLLACLSCGGQAWAEQASGVPPEAIARWQDMRFGMFVHWGPISILGHEIGWSRERGPNGYHGEIPVAVYDGLYKKFDAPKFDAKQWVAIAKAAGMKYLVFTSKHHDGFCEFDSKLTDYKVTSPACPLRRDVVKDLADACREAGLDFGIYYSQPDSYHPDYRTPNHAKYIEYLHGQVREVLSNYGPVTTIWFDGLGGTAADWDAKRLVPMIRQLQPNILINDRCGVPADYDTPEQKIGAFQTNRPWESCITICNQWAWKPNDEMKSLKQCIQTLVTCAGGDGNLLFNVGPMPSGEIEPRQVDRLKEMGQWLAKYGESIYGTRGGPFKPTAGALSTHKGNTVYVHVLKWDADTITLPPLPKKIAASSVVTGGAVKVTQDDQKIVLDVPKADWQDIDTIIRLDLDGR
jgi:alpha-L-fucosidase